MLNLNDVTQVNEKYVFLKFADGKQERITAKLEELRQLAKDIEIEIEHLKFVIKFTGDVYRDNEKLFEPIEKRLKYYDNFLQEHANESLVRRGLHDVCQEQEIEAKKRYKLSLISQGMLEVDIKARNELARMWELQKQISTVISVVNNGYAFYMQKKRNNKQGG